MIDCLYNRSRHHKQIFRSPQLLLTHRDNPFRSFFFHVSCGPKVRVARAVACYRPSGHAVPQSHHPLPHNPIIPCRPHRAGFGSSAHDGASWGTSNGLNGPGMGHEDVLIANPFRSANCRQSNPPHEIELRDVSRLSNRRVAGSWR